MPVTINASTSSGLISSADTSGTLQLQSNGTTQFTVDSTGAYGQVESATAVASTSGTSIEFTSVPSWVKRITVMFQTVSTGGTNFMQIQVGSSSFSTSGYASQFSAGASSSGVLTTGLGVASMGAGAASAFTGSVTLCLISANTWIEQGHLAYVNGSAVGWSSGGSTPALGGALDRLRIICSATGSPSDTFDAGSINILYE
jgi:hypothetical protein